jgi:hypothetical protein
MSTIAQSATPLATPPAPTRKRAISSIGFCVAERPIRPRRCGSPRSCACASVSAASRSSESARWLPRLLAATAWISSTITARTVASIARLRGEPSST